MKSLFTPVLFVLALLTLFNFSSFAQYPEKLQTKAARIHKAAFTVDSHTDTPLSFSNKKFNIAIDNSQAILHSCVYFPRMKKGGIDAVFFVVPSLEKDRTQESGLRTED